MERVTNMNKYLIILLPLNVAVLSFQGLSSLRQIVDLTGLSNVWYWLIVALLAGVSGLLTSYLITEYQKEVKK